MLQRLIESGLSSAERRLRLPGSLDYLRLLASQSSAAFAKFALFLPLASHRRRLPAEVYFAARIAASQHQDCGTCVQVEIAEARRRGVRSEVLRALVHRSGEGLPPEVAEAYRFAQAVAEQSPAADELREQVRARWADEGLAELALAISTAQLFPITKRALGLAQSCSAVQVEF